MLLSDRIRTGIDHPNSGDVEAFLNSWSEPSVPEGTGGDEFIFRSAVSHLRETGGLPGSLFFPGAIKAILVLRE